ncbi:four helix bundle protein [candidate division WOR-3 bacterium]|jgi:four helix bundle protein|nr:four helix bundle protein [candidate division WOR-3 bacterium]
MSKIERFEDIQAWQNARKAVSSIYEITKTGPFSKDFSLKDQIIRASISIPSNIAEGFSRRSNKEFIQFLFIAKSSASEVQTQLYLALDQKYITKNQFDEIYKEHEIISKQISKFITYLKGTC